MNIIQKWLLELLKAERNPSPPGFKGARILIVQIAGMGDFILGVPAIRALKKKFEPAQLDLLTSRRGYTAARNCPYIDNIEVWETSRALPVLSAIRRRKYDLAINLIGLYSPRGALRMGLLLRATGIPKLAGRDTLGTGTFFHFALDENPEVPKNERDSNLELARLLGAADEMGGALEAWPSAEEKEQALELIHELSGDGPVIGINPGSERHEKIWAEKSYLRVMNALHKEYGARFLLTGGAAENEIGERLCTNTNFHAVNTIGRISFHATIDLMQKMALFLTCDTAALHLAWAAGVRAVALFEEKNLGRYKPQTDRIFCLVDRKNESGRPIEIDAEEVLEACRGILASAAQGTP